MLEKSSNPKLYLEPHLFDVVKNRENVFYPIVINSEKSNPIEA